MFYKFGSNIFLVVFAVYVITLTVPYGYAEMGLDPSWNLGINMLISQGKIFGQDVAFTYGPLGFLNYRVLPEHHFSIYVFLLFDLVFVALSTWFVAQVIRRAGKLWYFFAGLFVYLFYPEGVFSDRVFSLLIYEIALILYAYYHRKAWPLVVAAAIATILVFIKVNVLFLASPYLWMALGIMAIQKRLKASLLAGVLILNLAGIGILSHVLKVDLPQYVANSIPLTNSYMDAMAMFQLYLKEFALLLSLEAALWLVLVWMIWQSRVYIREHIFVYFSGFLLLFLSFKQCHVGIGFGGYRSFLSFFPLPVLLIYTYSPESLSRLWFRTWIGIFLIQWVGILYTGYGVSDRSWSKYLDSRPIPHMNLLYYWMPFTWYDFDKNFEAKQMRLPDSTLKVIGSGTVDVLQHDLAYVFFNRLNYGGRPVIQSYTAYSPELIRLNGNYYWGPKAPDWVLFKLETYRNQNPFWMDSEVNWALMRRYDWRQQVVVKGDTLQMFGRRESSKKLKFNSVKLGRLELGKRIQLPRSPRVLLQVDARLNLWGRMMRLILQPPYLYVRLHYVDGQDRRYRVIEPILRTGVWAGVRVETQDDLRRFYLSEGEDNVPLEWMEFSSNVPGAWE